MKVAVQLFGPLAEQAGRSTLALNVAGSTLEDVLRALGTELPALRIDRSVRFAINLDYAQPDQGVKEGDVVSLIPPVGGG